MSFSQSLDVDGRIVGYWEDGQAPVVKGIWGRGCDQQSRGMRRDECRSSGYRR